MILYSKTGRQNGETSQKLNCEEVYVVKQVFTEMLLFQIPPLWESFTTEKLCNLL